MSKWDKHVIHIFIQVGSKNVEQEKDKSKAELCLTVITRTLSLNGHQSIKPSV